MHKRAATSKDRKEVPRWQQGFRPHAWGDVWDAMKPEERRNAFITDIIVAAIGCFLIFIIFGGLE